MRALRRRGRARRTGARSSSRRRALSQPRRRSTSRATRRRRRIFSPRARSAAGPVRVEGVGRDSIQGDVRFADVLERMGAAGRDGRQLDRGAAPSGGKLQGVRPRPEPHSRRRDDAGGRWRCSPTARARLRNIASWRVKETDRIAAMATELRKLGATVEEGADYLRITAAARQLTPAPTIDTYDDHRMAMCFSLAALGGVPVRINDPGCVPRPFRTTSTRFAAICVGRARERSPPVIAIDGPSASGKGTVAQRVARALGFHYLDSGALYRLVALAALRARRATWTMPRRSPSSRATLDVQFQRRSASCWTAQDVTGRSAREERVGVAASRVAALPAVRAGAARPPAGVPAAARAWSPTGATWARSCSRTRRSRSS